MVLNLRVATPVGSRALKMYVQKGGGKKLLWAEGKLERKIMCVGVWEGGCENDMRCALSVAVPDIRELVQQKQHQPSD